MAFSTSLSLTDNTPLGGNWLKEEEKEEVHFSSSSSHTLHSNSNLNNFPSSTPHPLHSSIYERSWMPYVNNGGSVIAVAGEDYAIIGGDTRLSVGFSIHTRYSSKLTKLTDKCVIATSGMQAEMETLHRILKARITYYEHEHRCNPSVCAIAQLLSTILYYKRFFPYYTFNLLAGIDNDGKGAVYGYDAVGSFDRGKYYCNGTGGSLMLSILDNQLSQTNQLIKKEKLNKLQTIDLVKDVITSAAERDIYTGDSAEIAVIDNSGISINVLELKKD